MVMDKLLPFSEDELDMENLRLCLYKKSCHDLDEDKEKTVLLLTGIKTMAEKDGAKYLVVRIPAEFQFDRKARLKYGITVPLLPADKEYTYEEFAGYFSQNGIDWTLYNLQWFQAVRFGC